MTFFPCVKTSQNLCSITGGYIIACNFSLALQAAVLFSQQASQRNVNRTLIKVASIFMQQYKIGLAVGPHFMHPSNLTPRCYPALCKHNAGFALRDVQSHIRWFLCFQPHGSEQEFLSKLSSLCLKQRKALCHYPSLTENKEDLKLVQVLIAGHMKVLPAFFPRLPICLAKMCLVVLRHILELPRHTMVLLCTFCTCNGYLVPITSPKCVRHVPKVCLGIIHLFSKKMIL